MDEERKQRKVREITQRRKERRKEKKDEKKKIIKKWIAKFQRWKLRKRKILRGTKLEW